MGSVLGKTTLGPWNDLVAQVAQVSADAQLVIDQVGNQSADQAQTTAKSLVGNYAVRVLSKEDAVEIGTSLDAIKVALLARFGTTGRVVFKQVFEGSGTDTDTDTDTDTGADAKPVRICAGQIRLADEIGVTIEKGLQRVTNEDDQMAAEKEIISALSKPLFQGVITKLSADECGDQIKDAVGRRISTIINKAIKPLQSFTVTRKVRANPATPNQVDHQARSQEVPSLFVQAAKKADFRQFSDDALANVVSSTVFKDQESLNTFARTSPLEGLASWTARHINILESTQKQDFAQALLAHRPEALPLVLALMEPQDLQDFLNHADFVGQFAQALLGPKKFRVIKQPNRTIRQFSRTIKHLQSIRQAKVRMLLW